MVLITCLAAFAAAALLTGLARHYALRRDLIDIPNRRSSHESPTPRGGGLAIAVVLLPAYVLAASVGWIPVRTGAAIVGGGLLVAGIGWLDDHRALSARTRALIHATAGTWAVAWMGGLPPLELGIASLDLGLVGDVLGVLGVVWLINLFNFMDGIDGIAAGEAVSGGLITGVLLLWAGAPGLAICAFLLAAACGGFLLWNWAPARIFMGDVGSGLLGYLVAALALASDAAGAVPLLVWVVVFAVFIVDATLTLMRRIIRGERWYEPHRSHAYQRAARSGSGHARVVRLVLLTNLGLALVAAAAVAKQSLVLVSLLVAASLCLGLYLVVERRLPMQHAARNSSISNTETTE